MNNTDTLPQIINAFTKEREGILTPNTFKSYSAVWINFAEYLEFKVVPPVSKDTDLTLSHIEHYLQSWKMQPSSFNLRRTSIFQMLKTLRSRGYNASFPYLEDWKDEVKALRSVSKKRLFLNEDEMQEVRDCLPLLTEDHRAVVSRVLMFDMIKELWLRISEVQQIDLQDINLEDKTLSVRGKGSATGKNGKRVVSAIMPISDALAASIAAYIANWRIHLPNEDVRPHPDFPASMDIETPLFVTRLKTRPTVAALQTPIVQAIRYSGVPIETSNGPHAIRRSMATIAYNDSKDIVAVSRKLRHHDLQTTMIYIGVSESDLGG